MLFSIRILFCCLHLSPHLFIRYPAHRISILTPYNGQRELILDVLKHRCAWNPLFGIPARVATVDQFQGQQNDCMCFFLFSFCRRGSLFSHFRVLFCFSALYFLCHSCLKPRNRYSLVYGSNKKYWSHPWCSTSGCGYESCSSWFVYLRKIEFILKLFWTETFFPFAWIPSHSSSTRSGGDVSYSSTGIVISSPVIDRNDFDSVNISFLVGGAEGKWVEESFLWQRFVFSLFVLRLSFWFLSDCWTIDETCFVFSSLHVCMHIFPPSPSFLEGCRVFGSILMCLSLSVSFLCWCL